MSYTKIEVDNIKCARRFHLAFDDESPAVKKVEVKCPFCDLVVFQAEDHPAVRLLRQENRVQSNELAELTMENCAFRDVMTEETVKDFKKGSTLLYP